MSTTKSADRPHGRAGGALGRFEAALSALEEHAGDNPELLAVGVLPSMAEFQVTDGQSARGYRYHAEGGEMGELKVKLVDPGSIVFQADSDASGPADATRRALERSGAEID